MRSLFAKILLWFLATMLVTLTGLILTNALTAEGSRNHPMPFAMFLDFQLREAVREYEAGGPDGLRLILSRFRARGHGLGILTDAQGHDLATGQDLSDLVERAQGRDGRPFWLRNYVVFARQDDEGRYWYFLLVPRGRWLLWFLHPQYLWVFLTAVLLCYALALHLTAPVRGLKKAVLRFGHGDLSARAAAEPAIAGRRDELGDLARTFDQMADRIQTLLAAERRLLLDISHELRSPLARLNLAVELARSGEDREAALERIQREADRLNRLLSELLEVTRAEGDPSSLRAQPARLDLVVNEVVRDCVIEAEARGCSLKLEDTPAVTLPADPELLRRAVENVVRNAIRYEPEGSAVEIRLENGAMARLAVRDHGTGVPEDELPRIFDPFYRVGTDRGRSSGGAGLGLAIARRAVELHHGRIHAHNANPGLLVEIELPTSSSAAASQ